MAMSVPSLRRICVLKVVEEIRNFCPGVAFEDLGKYYYIVGPLEYLCKGQCQSSWGTHINGRS